MAIITITIVGVICGADEWTEVEDVAHAKIDWLRRFLDLPHGQLRHSSAERSSTGPMARSVLFAVRRTCWNGWAFPSGPMSG